jgi:hypothetical protein
MGAQSASTQIQAIPTPTMYLKNMHVGILSDSKQISILADPTEKPIIADTGH